MSGFQATLVSDERTSTGTEKHEFIGHFRLKPEVQKELTRKNNKCITLLFNSETRADN